MTSRIGSTRNLYLCETYYCSFIPQLMNYDFLSSVYNYELVGPKLGMLAAMTWPWLELLVGVCLVGGALLASIGMAAMFTFILASTLYRGLEISCGCFGTSGRVTSYSNWLFTDSNNRNSFIDKGIQQFVILSPSLRSRTSFAKNLGRDKPRLFIAKARCFAPLLSCESKYGDSA